MKILKWEKMLQTLGEDTADTEKDTADTGRKFWGKTQQTLEKIMGEDTVDTGRRLFRYWGRHCRHWGTTNKTIRKISQSLI